LHKLCETGPFYDGIFIQLVEVAILQYFATAPAGKVININTNL